MNKFYVGVTDEKWFGFLAERKPDEVNFWRPSGMQNFRAIPKNAPFLFKLHSPLNFIVGGGFFASYSALPLTLAWDCFGEKNGASTLNELRTLIQKWRNTTEPNPNIGCTILVEPFFFERDEWIPIPQDWAPNIVSGKTYDMTEPVGARLWQDVNNRLHGQTAKPVNGVADASAQEAFAFYQTKHRLGQGAFRVMVMDAYNRRCAMTGERTLPVLEAAHIKPVSKSGIHEVRNGLLLRSDLHILFDRGYLTVDPNLHVNVSARIHEEFQNGRDYYSLQGSKLHVLPQLPAQLPDVEYLTWHNDNIFLT